MSRKGSANRLSGLTSLGFPWRRRCQGYVWTFGTRSILVHGSTMAMSTYLSEALECFAQTIENTREKDETLVEAGDPILEADEAFDEFASTIRHLVRCEDKRPVAHVSFVQVTFSISPRQSCSSPPATVLARSCTVSWLTCWRS